MLNEILYHHHQVTTKFERSQFMVYTFGQIMEDSRTFVRGARSELFLLAPTEETK